MMMMMMMYWLLLQYKLFAINTTFWEHAPLIVHQVFTNKKVTFWKIWKNFTKLFSKRRWSKNQRSQSRKIFCTIFLKNKIMFPSFYKWRHDCMQTKLLFNQVSNNDVVILLGKLMMTKMLLNQRFSELKVLLKERRAQYYNYIQFWLAIFLSPTSNQLFLVCLPEIELWSNKDEPTEQACLYGYN